MQQAAPIEAKRANTLTDQISFSGDTPPVPSTDPNAIIPGTSELARLIRAHDWSATPLGPIGSWPQSLRSAVSMVVASPTAIVMLWGPDGVMIYNDAYSVFAGARHPQLLGSNVRDGWAEVADFNDHVMKVGLAGGTLAYKDQELTLYRHGVPEQIWMNLDYSPLYDESGRPAGVIAIVVETSERVLADRRAAAERDRLHRMLQQMPGFAAMLSGPDFVYEYVNDAYVAISERSDFIGRRFRDVFPDIEGQGFFELLDHVYQTGRGVVQRTMELRLHGSAISQYIDFVFEPIRDETGKVSGIFIGGYEVTEAHRATLALRELNADLERQVAERMRERARTWEVSPDLLGVVNAQACFESSNPAWQAVLGWTAEELATTPFFDLLHPDDVAPNEAAFEAAIERGVPAVRLENRYRTRDGGYRWLSWVAVPEGGKVYCSGRDITPDKAAEAERDRLWTLSEDMLGRADYAGNMTAVNPAWTKVLGWSAEKLLADPYADIIHPENVETVVAALHEMARSGEPKRFENRILTADGVWKPIGWTVAPEPGGVHFIAVGRDLSEDKARERELRQAQDALRQAQKMEAVGQLTGGIAHDFNNLLAGISGNLELLELRMGQGRTEGLDRYIGVAQEAARRAAALTQRLLAFSRRQTLDPRPTDVNRLIAGMEDLIRRTVGPAIEVEVVGAGGLWPIRVDASQLENALLNLAINARDAMSAGGRITIETANKWLDDRAARERDLPPGHYISLCVTDTGSGMTADVMAQAFDPFFTTKPLGQGTGLGLSMIHGFVRQSGGQVRIYSEIDKGTTMCLYFPRFAGELDGADEAGETENVEPGQGETILVIDDEDAVRRLVTEILDESGYSVIEASDGPAGLRILQSDVRIDLLVTDVGLPGGLNGRQVADAARLLRPELRILFITGYAENAAVGNGLLDIGMEVITKPFGVAALGVKIRDMLDRP